MNQAQATEDRILEALSNVPGFLHLGDRQRRKLARLCTLKSLEAGDVLYEEGALALSLFIVVSGTVESYKVSDDRRIALGNFTAGSVVGQLALLDDQPRAASAQALEPTECLQLTRDSFDTLIKKDPQVAWCLTQGLATRVRDLVGLAVAAELAQGARASATPEAANGAASEPEGGARTAAETSGPHDSEEDEDQPSAMGSALFRMMRMQYGFMAGTARGVTETARAMERFLESLGEEIALNGEEDWGDLLEKIPDAMMTATSNVMDECEKVPQGMMDAYRRYSDGET